jgi:UDP-N-acetylglucosamine 2-epimerase
MRERGKNVIDVPNTTQAIERGLKKALTDRAFLQKVRRAKNPYDQGDTAKRVVHVLETVRLPKVQKVITY